MFVFRNVHNQQLVMDSNMNNKIANYNSLLRCISSRTIKLLNNKQFEATARYDSQVTIIRE